jgi:hypothetical protein
MRSVRVDHCNAPSSGTETMQRVEHAGIVGAVDARLHNDDTLQAEGLLVNDQTSERSGTRHVRSVGRQRKTVVGAENVHMAVAGSSRHLETERTMLGFEYSADGSCDGGGWAHG